jgi:soluble lytic murein transglycosylase-like protein
MLLALCCSPAPASAIYRSVAPDGTVRFASEALDASYRLYLEDEEPAVAGGGASPLPDSRRRARPRDTRSAWSALIRQLADRHGVDPALVEAVVAVESGFNPAAVSRKGAVGLMQVLPATAARYGIDTARARRDPARNIEAGILHLKHLLTLHHGSLALALAAYNAGEGAVARHGGRIPPYRETMLYVPAVLSRLQDAGAADDVRPAAQGTASGVR